VVRDSLGRETDHRTPCDEGDHSLCQDPTCDCPHHEGSLESLMTQVDQYRHDTEKGHR
jgi:hypothetical protein